MVIQSGGVQPPPSSSASASSAADAPLETPIGFLFQEDTTPSLQLTKEILALLHSSPRYVLLACFLDKKHLSLLMQNCCCFCWWSCWCCWCCIGVALLSLSLSFGTKRPVVSGQREQVPAQAHLRRVEFVSYTHGLHILPYLLPFFPFAAAVWRTLFQPLD